VKKIIILLISIFISSVALAKDNITIGMKLEPPHLDPTINSASAIDEVVYGNIFEGLFQITESGGVKNLLVKDYKISKDFKKYTFYIKDNVYFHNGDKLSADDIVFSISRIFNKDSINPRKSLFDNVKTIFKVDNNTVVVLLKSSSDSLIYDLARPEAVIFNHRSYKNNKNNPIGTGPFIFFSMKKGYFVKINRFEKYHSKPAKLKSAKFRFISDSLSASSAILSGEIDGFPVYQDVMTLPAFKKDRFNVVFGSTEGEVLLALNNRHKFLSNPQVRKALNYAIDKKSLISIVSPSAKPIGSHYPPHAEGYVDLSNKYPYNAGLAKKLLKQAGADNMTLEFTVPPSYKTSADVIASYLRKVGIKVKMKNVDWGTWLSQTYKKYDYDITIIAHLEPKDYGIYARKNYYFGYNNSHYQDLIKKLKTEINKNKRLQLLKKIQVTLSDDAVNVWLYQAPKIGVWNKKLSGMWKNYPVAGNILKDVYWQ